MNSWDTGTTREGSVDVDFLFQEGGVDREVFEFDGNVFASINACSWKVMSFMNPLQSLRMLITYVHSAEASPTDSPLKLVFTGYA